MGAVVLPSNQQPIAGPNGITTRAYYRLFGQLADSATSNVNLASDVDTLKKEVADLSRGIIINGIDSVSISGSSSSGIYTVSLHADSDNPGALSFYGAFIEGKRGWQSFNPDTFDVSVAGTLDLKEITATALTNLSYPNVVAVDGEGNAYYPDLTNPTDVARIVGVTKNAAAAGAPVAITQNHTFTEVGWNWSPGRIYCGASGALTQTIPTTGAVIEVARVITPTSIRVGIQQPIIVR